MIFFGAHPHLDGVFSAVVGAAARVVSGIGCESVAVFGLSVQGRQDVDVTLITKDINIEYKTLYMSFLFVFALFSHKHTYRSGCDAKLALSIH